MKKEVEELLGFEITDHQFKEALEYAKKKQAYIYKQEQREAVMQPWYLVKRVCQVICVSFLFYFIF